MAESGKIQANSEETQFMAAPGSSSDPGSEVLRPRPSERKTRPASGRLAPLMPPDQRYRIGSMLGEGGMAMVYEAHDHALHRIVAFKVLKDEFEADAECRARFFYEAGMLSQMDHPGILPVFEMGVHPEHGSFYTMKKVKGQTLEQILTQRRIFRSRNPEDILHIIRIYEKICLTVAYAHSLGIIHRDLKPENIMVDDFGVVLVMDWGLAKKMRPGERESGIRHTRTGIIKGTPAFMSPEQIAGDATGLSPQSDVFALGVILFEILTGRLPFRGETPYEVMEKIRDEDVPRVRAVNPRANRVLAAICQKALEKDPAKRYPSAREFADDIRCFLDDLPVFAYEPTRLEGARAWTRRHPVLTAVALTCLGMLLMLGILHGFDIAITRYGIEQDMGKWRRSLAVFEDLNQEIDALRAQLMHTPLGDHDAREELLMKIARRETEHYALSLHAENEISGLLAVIEDRAGKEWHELDPVMITFIKEMLLNQIEGLIRQREWWKAHWHLTMLLQSPTMTKLSWSETERARLDVDLEQTRAELRKQYPHWQEPNWQTFIEDVRRRIE